MRERGREEDLSATGVHVACMTQERESDRRSKEIEQRKESQKNTHKQNNKDM